MPGANAGMLGLHNLVTARTDSPTPLGNSLGGSLCLARWEYPTVHPSANRAREAFPTCYRQGRTRHLGNASVSDERRGHIDPDRTKMIFVPAPAARRRDHRRRITHRARDMATRLGILIHEVQLRWEATQRCRPLPTGRCWTSRSTL